MAPKKTEIAPVIEQPDDEIAQVISRRITHTPVGLIYQDGTTFEEWLATYNFYWTLKDRTNWLLGDCLRHGEHAYGEKYSQAVDMGKSTSYLTSIVSICGRFSDHSRRRQSLSFDSHAAVAYLPPQTADTILDQAVKLKWSRDDIRDAAAKAKGLPTKAQREKAKQEKEASQVRLLPPAANPPPVLDGHITVPEKAPVWNGYPVTTDGARLLIGSDVIPTEESEHCAHHHGHANAETMILALGSAKPCVPEAPAPAQPASEPVPVTPPPKPAPSPTIAPQQGITPAADQPLAIERAEAALNRLLEAAQEVDWTKFEPLSAKRWLRLLIPLDEVIDTLQSKIPGANRT